MEAKKKKFLRVEGISGKYGIIFGNFLWKHKFSSSLIIVAKRPSLLTASVPFLYVILKT